MPVAVRVGPWSLPEELLERVFQQADGHMVAVAYARVARAWRAASLSETVWRELVWKRWRELNPELAGADTAPELFAGSAGAYALMDVYFRLVAMPCKLTKNSSAIVTARGVDARFVGAGLGNNQSVRADAPWPAPTAEAAGASGPAPAPFGVVRAVRSNEGVRLVASLSLAHYFEVTVHRRTGGGPPDLLRPPCVAVGMCSERFPLRGKMPGWDRNSLAFHGDDGCKFMNHGHGQPYGPSFGEGDTVGCGVAYGPRVGAAQGGEDPGRARFFFTLNGRLLPDPRFPADRLAAHPLYACVGLDSYAPITVNFGQEPFEFDLDAFGELATVLARSHPATSTGAVLQDLRAQWAARERGGPGAPAAEGGDGDDQLGGNPALGALDGDVETVVADDELLGDEDVDSVTSDGESFLGEALMGADAPESEGSGETPSASEDEDEQPDVWLPGYFVIPFDAPMEHGELYLQDQE